MSDQSPANSLPDDSGSIPSQALTTIVARKKIVKIIKQAWRHLKRESRPGHAKSVWTKADDLLRVLPRWQICVIDPDKPRDENLKREFDVCEELIAGAREICDELADLFTQTVTDQPFVRKVCTKLEKLVSDSLKTLDQRKEFKQ